MSVTFKPLDSRMVPKDADAMPLPKDETTPPVTKTYLVMQTLYKIGRKGNRQQRVGRKFTRLGQKRQRARRLHA